MGADSMDSLDSLAIYLYQTGKFSRSYPLSAQS